MVFVMSNRHYLLKRVSRMFLNMTFLVTKTPDLSTYLPLFNCICLYVI